MRSRAPVVVFFATLSIAACATASAPLDDGSGNVSGGGRTRDGGRRGDAPASPDEGSIPADSAPSPDSAPLESGADGESMDAGADMGPPILSHGECPATSVYANKYLAAPPTATVCTMGGPECAATECCYLDLCLPF